MVAQQENGSALAVRAQGEMVVATSADFMPVMSIENSIARYNTVVEFAKRVMKAGRDYGVIPGTGKKKSDDGTPSSGDATLLKAGAEKLCTLFGLTPDFQDYRVVEEWDKGFFYYAYKCNLLRGGRLIASGIGSANSKEKKYRRFSRACPECGVMGSIKRSKYPPRGRDDEAPGWYCHDKAGGCGANFDANDPAIIDQQPSQDPADAADNVNTLQKMAQKRALVAATLIATNASEFFTQDLEDAGFIDGEVVDPTPPPTKPASTKPAAPPDMKDDEVFREAWHAAITARGFTVEEADELLKRSLKKKGIDLAGMNVKHRLNAGLKAQRGDYDEDLRAIHAELSGQAPAEPVDQPQSEPPLELPNPCDGEAMVDLAVTFAPKGLDEGEAARQFQTWLKTKTAKPWVKLSRDEQQRIFDAVQSDDFPWDVPVG